MSTKNTNGVDQQAAQAAGAATEQSAKATADAEKIIENAKEQAAKILDDAKRQAEAVAQAAEDTAQAEALPIASDPGEELVRVRLFKDGEKYKDDVFVAVNGERVQIRRGEDVMVKRKFADVLEQSMRQDTATANMIDAERSEFERKAAAINL